MRYWIVLMIMMILLGGCGNMSQKDQAMWKAIDDITDVLLDIEPEEE